MAQKLDLKRDHPDESIDYESFCTCTFCDNLVYSKNGRLAKTPICSSECKKKIVFKPMTDSRNR